MVPLTREASAQIQIKKYQSHDMHGEEEQELRMSLWLIVSTLIRTLTNIICTCTAAVLYTVALPAKSFAIQAFV